MSYIIFMEDFQDWPTIINLDHYDIYETKEEAIAAFKDYEGE